MSMKYFKEVILLCALVTVPFPTVFASTHDVTFTHGVASGDVTPFSAVLWTRTNKAAELRLEVATDPDFRHRVFRRVLRRVVQTSDEHDFTAKVIVFPLRPNTTFFYRWRSEGVSSETGTFKTAPPGRRRADVRFAFSGDSDGTRVRGVPFFNNFEVLDAIRREGEVPGEDLDFFVYLGDTIYSDSQLRPDPPGSAKTLDEYRDVYKVNRQNAHLRELLSDTSVYAIWDDHEVRNDWNGETVDPTRFANGRRAFLEYMPVVDLRLPRDPGCAGPPLFRYFPWGKDVDIIVLDERSCRSRSADEIGIPDPTAPTRVIPFCLNLSTPALDADPFPTLPMDIREQIGNPNPRENEFSDLVGLLIPSGPPFNFEACLAAIRDPTRTMLGPTQKALLKAILRHSRAKFKFVINEVPIQQLYINPYDSWEGYAAERAEILNFIRDNHIKNVIFLTTDQHANLVNEVFIDAFDDPEPIALELVTGPIATFRFETAIRLALDPFPGLSDRFIQFVSEFLMGDVLGVDCRNLDSFSYGLVEVDAYAGTTTVTLKDDLGMPLSDDLLPSVGCQKTIYGQ